MDKEKYKSIYKEIYFRHRKNNWLGKLIYFFNLKFIYKLQNYYYRYKETLERVYSWAKFSWNNYDFDSVYVHRTLVFKLKRLQDCLKHSIAEQKEEDLNALQELIEIYERLAEDDYDTKYLDAHDLKWGKSEVIFEGLTEEDKNKKVFVKGHYLNKPKNVKNEQDKKQERKEFMQVFKYAEKDRYKDIDRLAQILKKHSRTWWD